MFVDVCWCDAYCPRPKLQKTQQNTSNMQTDHSFEGLVFFSRAVSVQQKVSPSHKYSHIKTTRLQIPTLLTKKSELLSSLGAAEDRRRRKLYSFFLLICDLSARCSWQDGRKMLPLQMISEAAWADGETFLFWSALTSTCGRWGSKTLGWGQMRSFIPTWLKNATPAFTEEKKMMVVFLFKEENMTSVFL